MRRAKPPIQIFELYPKPPFLSNLHIPNSGLYPQNNGLSSIVKCLKNLKYQQKLFDIVIKCLEKFQKDCLLYYRGN